jgi:predicted DNA-binding protein
MPVIRLEKEIEQELGLLAKTRGSNRSAAAREAILRYMEDNEDLILVKNALSSMKGSKSLKQVRKEMGTP